ncbi:serine hydrolase [Flavobacterium sp. H122]|uniref:serine hydrolase n=1 Tax=Flavobacterium sp. H122 TaxID=2529860 RepID=UPI0010A9B1E4|nr:serine hydrolase [Flavobacterium sp. H122]
MKSANEIGVFNGNVIVSENGKIIYHNELGFTDYTKSKKLSRESIMPIGSITKEFSSTGILFLVENGKLNLEDNVSDYLTYLPNWATKIQIKHLLQYTSGLPSIFKNTNSEYLAELNKVKKLDFEPGTGYIYSNANIFLQQEIIKKITNLSYEDFLKNKFFKKLKISGGKTPKDSILIANMAGSFDNDFKETTFIHGGGEMYFSITDLYNWVNNLHNEKIVNKNSLTILAKSFDKNSESSLGNTVIENNEITEHSHQGSGNNYESYIYYESKNRTTIVLITNNQNFKLGAITESILNILAEKPFTIPKKSIYLDIRGKLLENFQNGISFYEQIKSTQKEKYDFSNEVSDLINTGKYLMRRNRFEDAIKIFQLSTTIDSKNTIAISSAYSFIGECYNKMEKADLAIINLKKALEFDAKNKNAEEMLKRIENK